LLSLGGHSKQGGDEGDLTSDVSFPHTVHLSLPNHVHGFVSLAWCHVSCHEAQSSKREIPFCEKYSASPEQGRLFPLVRGVFLVRTEGFPERKLLERGSDALSALLSRSLVSTLRFLTASVTPGPIERRIGQQYQQWNEKQR